MIKKKKTKQDTSLASIAKSVNDLAVITNEGFKQVDKRFERVEKKLFDQDVKLERVEERLDKTLIREEYLQGQDEMMTILKRLDQERIFTAEWVRRVEDEVEKQKQQIEKHERLLNKVKVELKIRFLILTPTLCIKKDWMK